MTLPFVRLSQSPIWSGTSEFYRDLGVDAWVSGGVPNHVTNNPVIARTYASLIVDWMELQDLDASKPVYIIELGAGPGVLAARLMRALLPQLLPGHPPVVYVLTDLIEANLEHAAAHPVIRTLIDEGVLDTAVLDLEQPRPLTLRHSGQVLDPRDPGNPVVLVANYILDTVRQDLFHGVGRRLYEVRARPAPLPDDPDDGLDLEIEEHAIDGPYYQEPFLDGLLEAYRLGLTDGYVLVPAQALQSIRWLVRLGADRSLLLVGDKSRRHLKHWDGVGLPYIAIHQGAVSTWANVHAVLTLFEHLGGRGYMAPTLNDHFVVSALVSGLPEGAEARMDRAWRRWGEGFGASEQSHLWGRVKKLKKVSFPQIMSLMSLFGDDPYVLHLLLDRILATIDDVDERWHQELFQVLERVRAQDVPLGSEDLEFDIGRLYYHLGEHESARACFQRSLERHGPHPATLCNLGLCAERLGDVALARRWFQTTLKYDGEHTLARTHLADLPSP